MPDSLPFDPEDVKVDALPDALAEIDDLDDLRALQQADTRTTASPHYERRIGELDGPDYIEEAWANKVRSYRCSRCPFAHTDETIVSAHVASRHGD